MKSAQQKLKKSDLSTSNDFTDFCGTWSGACEGKLVDNVVISNSRTQITTGGQSFIIGNVQADMEHFFDGINIGFMNNYRRFSWNSTRDILTMHESGNIIYDNPTFSFYSAEKQTDFFMVGEELYMNSRLHFHEDIEVRFFKIDCILTRQH